MQLRYTTEHQTVKTNKKIRKKKGFVYSKKVLEFCRTEMRLLISENFRKKNTPNSTRLRSSFLSLISKLNCKIST